jgi:predicted RNase H-like nuclease (RuvC/YqgF family)
MNQNGECNKHVLEIYESEIQALEAQKDALNRVNKAKRDEKTRLEDRFQRLNRKMLEFENRKIKQPTPQQEWHSYEMYVLLWRDSHFQIEQVEKKQKNIKHLKERCEKQIVPIQASKEACEDFLNW